MFPPSVNDRVPEMIYVLIICWTILLTIGMLTVSNFKLPASQLYYEDLQQSLL